MFFYFVIGWLAIGLFITLGAAFMQGYKNTPEWARLEELNDVASVAFGWPIIIIFFIGWVLFVGPFAGLQKLGEFVRKHTRQ